MVFRNDKQILLILVHLNTLMFRKDDKKHKFTSFCPFPDYFSGRPEGSQINKDNGKQNDHTA